MNPLDIMNLAKCKTLKQDVIVGDFTTRMVGPQHSIHNSQAHDYDDIHRNQAITKAMIENLKGSRQIKNLFSSTIQATVNTMRLLLQNKIHVRDQSDVVRRVLLFLL